MVILTLSNVSKEYGQGTTLVHALSGINLEIHAGEFVVIIGKSGSGKSTLLSLIGGLERPSSGIIKLKGQSLETLSEDDLAILRREEIGIIFQHFHLMDAMTAIENIELPLLIAGVDGRVRSEKSKVLLEKVGLDHRATHYPNELSGGERQRIGIARALVNDATILIADEPTGDLDSKKGIEILDLLIELNKTKRTDDTFPTVIMVTHDLGLIKTGMRVIELKDGQIINDSIK